MKSGNVRVEKPKESTAKVLLVSQDAPQASRVRSVLSELGDSFDMEHAKGCEPALKRLEADGIDVVLLDLTPPEKNLDSFLQIRDKAGLVPIVLLSSQDSRPLAAKAVHAGAYDYVMAENLDSSSLDAALGSAARDYRRFRAFKRLSGHLDTSLASLRAVLELCPGPAFVVNADKVLFQNPAAEGLLEESDLFESLERWESREDGHSKDDADSNEDLLVPIARVLPTIWDGSPASLVMLESDRPGAPPSGRALFEQAIAAQFVSGPGGTLLRCNRAFRELFEVPDEGDLSSIGLRKLFQEEADFRGLLKELFEKHRLDHYQLDLHSLNDAPLSLQGNLWAEFGSEGEITRIFGSLFDMTSRRRLEDQLRKAQKFEALGQLVGGVAHDFNNLLTLITGSTKFLIEELGDRKHLRERGEAIQEALEKAANLTQQLLAFSRSDDVRVQALDLSAVVAGMQGMLSRLIGENLRFSTELKRPVGSIMADRSQIEQVIVNLVVNAADAMPEGGTLRVRTDDVELDEDFAPEVVTLQPGRYSMLAVQDTGAGMAPDVQDRIFEPFFTTKESGTGLGLATVYGIVKQCGGYISVSSRPRKGTTFRIYFPQVSQAARQPEAPQQEASGRDSGGTETVLLVEDVDGLREVICEVLESSGYKVLTAGNGREALDRADRFKKRIHLLLTDVVMPGMSGRELADRLSALRKDMKILYMSGHTDSAIVHHGVLEPGTAFLQKPFSPGGLLDKVRRVLDRDEEDA